MPQSAGNPAKPKTVRANPSMGSKSEGSSPRIKLTPPDGLSSIEDQGWNVLPEGMYQYAVRAVYSAQAHSQWAFSNRLKKESSAMETAAGQTGIRAYPNPASDRLCIQAATEISEYAIYTTAGQQAARGTVRSKLFHIDVQGLPAGLYHCVLHLNDGSLRILKFAKR